MFSQFYPLSSQTFLHASMPKLITPQRAPFFKVFLCSYSLPSHCELAGDWSTASDLLLLTTFSFLLLFPRFSVASPFLADPVNSLYGIPNPRKEGLSSLVHLFSYFPPFYAFNRLLLPRPRPNACLKEYVPTVLSLLSSFADTSLLRLKSQQALSPRVAICSPLRSS